MVEEAPGLPGQVALVELSVVIGEPLDGLHYFPKIFDNLWHRDLDDQYSGPILACGMIFATSTYLFLSWNLTLLLISATLFSRFTFQQRKAVPGLAIIS